MNIGYESLLITIAFILPGFITTRLINARTPSVGKKQSIFYETTESLLRSVYIHIIIGIILIPIFQFIFIPTRSNLFSDGVGNGLENLYNNNPFFIIWSVIIWLLLAFILAFLSGYFWDPLDVLSEKLVKKTGTLTEDPFFIIRTSAHEKRQDEEESVQLWVRPRMKDGSQYQGEFVFGGYRSEGNNRELILSEAIYYQSGENEPSETHDFVMLDTSNCASIEFIIHELKH
jgi:hypothetical protein